MKKIYTAPTAQVHNVNPTNLICTSPNSGYSTQDIQEEENVVFESAKYRSGLWEE